jgi:hypothetical protein
MSDFKFLAGRTKKSATGQPGGRAREPCPMDAEHKPVTIAKVIAGGRTIATHCLACGHRGELDPRVLAVIEGEATTMGAIERERLPLVRRHPRRRLQPDAREPRAAPVAAQPAPRRSGPCYAGKWLGSRGRSGQEQPRGMQG